MLALDIIIVAGGIAVFILSGLLVIGLCMAAAAGDRQIARYREPFTEEARDNATERLRRTA